MKPSAYYAEGIALQIRSFHYGYVLNISGYPVHILAGIECTGVKEAKVFMLLSEGDERHPQCHASRALDRLEEVDKAIIKLTPRRSY